VRLLFALLKLSLFYSIATSVCVRSWSVHDPL